jgi:hypothetical protein
MTKRLAKNFSIKQAVFFLLIFVPTSSWAQWNRNATNGWVFFTTTSDYLGIGTNAPAEKLHIEGSVRGNQSGALRISTGTGWIDVGPRNALYAHFMTDRDAFYFQKQVEFDGPIASYGTTNLRFKTNAVDRITVLSSNGNVGIGTTAPEAKLHVSGNIVVDASTPAIYTGTGASELNRYLHLSNSIAMGSASGLKAGGVLVSDDFGFAQPSKTDLIVKGNVGIGTPLTSNPNGYKLSVNGKINASAIYINDQPIAGSQWTGSGSNLYYTGPVGIGAPFTSNPNNYSLNVAGKVNATQLLVNDQPMVSSQWATVGTAVHYDGAVGIGTDAQSNPNNYSLLVNGKVNATQLLVNDQPIVSSQWATAGSAVHYDGTVGIGTNAQSNPNNYSLLVNGKVNASQLYMADKLVVSSQWNTAGNNIYFNGAVGIGTSNPGDFQFAVNGNVGAKGVRVTKNNAAWPDYVFAKQYRLPSLMEVEKFIETNHHLEDVPSATEVEKDGHDLGEMDAILLKKLEELTLYIIKQQKEIELLKKQLQELK